MAGKQKEDVLATYATQLKERFDRWDHILEHGAGDPGWPDGVNINLVRNHILYYKGKIEAFMEEESQESSLFGSSYPDIYYRKTPPEMPQDFMAHPERIRARAEEQLALYKQNPDFCYVRDHYKEAFPNGETKETRAAHISISKFLPFERYSKYVEQDDIMQMRIFAQPYESAAAYFAETANLLREYFAQDHSRDDPAKQPDLIEEENLDPCCDFEQSQEEDELEAESDVVEKPICKETAKPSLEAQIASAQKTASKQEKGQEYRSEQLTLF